MKKKLSLIIMTMFLMTTVFAGCSTDQGSAGEGEETSPMKIGIIQIVEHPSLDTIRTSIIDQLATDGYVDGENISIDYQNAQGDPNNLNTISQKFATGGYDLIIAIATPSAQSVAAATIDIPIIFSAVTDPVAAGLVESLDAPGGNITGTSDFVSATKIMDLAVKIQPDVKTIGALYSTSEVNSASVVAELEEYADANGLEVAHATVTNSSEVNQATTSLIGKVDAIFIPIDNTVASTMVAVAEIAKENNLPVYVGADSMVADGGLATDGIDYEVLGMETAKIAKDVLMGISPSEIPVKVMSDTTYYVNQTTADTLGITIPDDVLSDAIILE